MSDAAPFPSDLDLTACDREPIHAPGAVQPFGFLIAVSAEWQVTRVSANVPSFLGLEAADLIGAPLTGVLAGEAVGVIRSRLQNLRGPDAVERIFRLTLRDGRPPFDVAVHLSDQMVVIEAEPSVEDDINSGTLVREMITRLHRAGSFVEFCREAGRQMRALTGFDRVMVYRIDADGAGEVIAETARPGVESYFGLHFPASDIPQQARTLYERNWLRIIPDVRAAPVPILPAGDPDAASRRGEAPLDLSLGVLRSVSPIHLEYLRNMGAAASMSVSILRGGKLWGLFACHHFAPRHLSFERRTAAELFGQMVSLLLESRERDTEMRYEAEAREVHTRLMSAIAAAPSPLDSIVGLLDDTYSLIACDGVGISIDGRVGLRGETPTEAEFARLVPFLAEAAAGRLYATSHIARAYEPGSAFVDRAAGLLAIPISRTPSDYLVFFRRELTRSVTWGGNPGKPVEPRTDGSPDGSPGGARLNPRKSFEAWTEIIRHQSRPWTEADLRIAESLRVSLLDVILRLTDVAERERRKAQERQELLIAELNHRVRNILTLIRGLVSQSQSDARGVEEFSAVVGGRIQALARAHDQITADNWAPASLRGLIAAESGAYLGARADRIVMSGPDVLLVPQAFSILALVVHELMTNSAKYGALSDARGRVRIEWTLDADRRLVLHWQEEGGPAVEAPTRRGFGTTIIERSIPFDLKGEAQVDYSRTGLRARFVVPAAFVDLPADGDDAAAAAAASLPPSTRLAGPALLVEDNMIIALDAEEMLTAMGASHVEMTSSVGDALAAIDRTPPGFALLDLNLGTETSVPVAARLQALGVPWMFATGYGEGADLPPELKDAQIVRKPYTRETLETALAAVRARQG